MVLANKIDERSMLVALTQPIEDYYPVRPVFVNHDILSCRADGVQGSYLDCGRALGITTAYDIIQLHPQLMDELPAICAHYDRIGLSYTSQIIWNLDYAELQDYPRYEGSYFCYGEVQHQVARNENWFRVASYIQATSNFMALAAQLEMPTVSTRSFNSISELDADTLARLRYPCYLKATLCASGLASYRAENESALRTCLAYFGAATPFQIQEGLNASCFLNLQYQVIGSHLERLAATEQFLEGTLHQGNRFPTPHNAWHCVEPMAKWLFSHGMRGILAFEVAVSKDACGTEYLPMACQPRFTDATYPMLIAKKLGIQRWQARSFSTRFRSVAALPIADLEYNPADQSGIVLVNWGPLAVGKLQLLIAGTPVQQQALREELERRL
jgi:hypothetical protein